MTPISLLHTVQSPRRFWWGWGKWIGGASWWTNTEKVRNSFAKNEKRESKRELVLFSLLHSWPMTAWRGCACRIISFMTLILAYPETKQGCAAKLTQLKGQLTISFRAFSQSSSAYKAGSCVWKQSFALKIQESVNRGTVECFDLQFEVHFSGTNRCTGRGLRYANFKINCGDCAMFTQSL